jgi:hypothetical protein
MDAARRKDTLLVDKEEPIDEYSLSFWFSPVGAPDVLIKQTSETAAICHQETARVSRKAAQIPDSHRTRGISAVTRFSGLWSTLVLTSHPALNFSLRTAW